MPKILDYPQASFDKALKLAEAVQSLGGDCSKEIAGNKIGLTGTSGGFKSLIGAAAKFNLIKVDKGTLYISDLFKAINLSYTPEEKLSHLRSSFLSPAIFRQLYDKLKGQQLPIDILDKILIKEYKVDDDSASRVSKYFIAGAKSVHLINEGNVLVKIEEKDADVEILDDEIEAEQEEKTGIEKVPNFVSEQSITVTDKYLIQILGPGLNSRLEINEADDLIIVEAMLNKIKKKLQNGTD